MARDSIAATHSRAAYVDLEDNGRLRAHALDMPEAGAEVMGAVDAARGIGRLSVTGVQVQAGKIPTVELLPRDGSLGVSTRSDFLRITGDLGYIPRVQGPV